MELDGGASEVKSKVVPDDDILQGLLELGAIASILIGGPQGSLGLSIIKVLKTFDRHYETPPELQKYHDLVERLEEGRKRREG